MKNGFKTRTKLFLLFGLTFLPRIALADCASVIKDHINWADGTYNYVIAEFTSSKNKETASFGAHGQAFFRSSTGGTKLEADMDVAFSDRDYFSQDKVDHVRLTLNANGTAGVTLLSWGNGKLPIQALQCTTDRFGAYISGQIREGNGTSQVSISLKKHDDDVL